MVRGVATHLMFAGDASAALSLYATVFSEFCLDSVEHYCAGEAGAEGTVRRADVTFGQHRIIVIDSPVKHAFGFTPATSLFVDCDSASALDVAFSQLAAGGQIFMPIANY